MDYYKLLQKYHQWNLLGTPISKERMKKLEELNVSFQIFLDTFNLDMVYYLNEAEYGSDQGNLAIKIWNLNNNYYFNNGGIWKLN